MQRDVTGYDLTPSKRNRSGGQGSGTQTFEPGRRTIGGVDRGLLTIALYWFPRGQPTTNKVRRLGSFEAWCETVGEMPETARAEGFPGNADTMFVIIRGMLS